MKSGHSGHKEGLKLFEEKKGGLGFSLKCKKGRRRLTP
jgi:hypothetical protein